MSPVSHALDRVEVKFDDPNLVANAGLVLVGTLVVRLELECLVDSLVRLTDRVGGALPGRQLARRAQGHGRSLSQAPLARGSPLPRRLRPRGGGQALGSVLAPLASGEPVSASPAGGQAVATFNAVLGDRLEEAGNPLALPMTLRSRQTDVPLDRASLSDAFPNATPRVVVFVHGLGETDLSWIGRDDAGRPWSYANALEPSGWTGALVRYNTGRRIAANGASLATLLDEMVAAWPVEVADLALVGHSMGGLVLRSACATGIDAGHSWPALVRSCVYLGSPHHGAPLEQGVSTLAWLLSRLPETGAVASALRLRSAGIQDLGRATLADAGQLGEEEQAEPEAGLLPSARHHLVAGRLGRTLFNPVAVLGDLMVGERSALGLGNRRVAALDPCERATFPGTHHYGLLKDRRVAEALVGWLG